MPRDEKVYVGCPGAGSFWAMPPADRRRGGVCAQCRHRPVLVAIKPGILVKSGITMKSTIHEYDSLENDLVVYCLQ